MILRFLDLTRVPLKIKVIEFYNTTVLKLYFSFWNKQKATFHFN